MTNQQDLSTPAQVRRYLMASIRISNEVVDSSRQSEWRRRFEFFEFTDGDNDESGLIVVDPITAQRFEIRIKEEE